jgi:hypothetical protein
VALPKFQGTPPEGDQDYSRTCPIGFGPGDYAGACVSTSSKSHCIALEFSSVAEEQKKAVSQECGVFWPVKGQCTRDYTEPCPLGWKKDPLSVRTCTTADGSKTENLADRTVAGLKDFETQAKVKFPCARPPSVVPPDGPLLPAQYNPNMFLGTVAPQ